MATAPPVEEPQSVAPTLFTYLALMLVVTAPLGVMISPFFVSLIAGLMLAVLSFPAYSRLRRRLPPWAAALTVTLGSVLLVVVPVAALAIGAVRQGAVMLAQLAAGDAPTLSEAIDQVIRWLPFAHVFGTRDELRAALHGGADRLAAAAGAWALNELQGLPDRLLQLSVVALSTYFLLVDGRRLLRWVAEKLPLSRVIRAQLIASFREATVAVVLASVMAAAAQSLVLLVAFLALGVPAPLLGGGASFVLAWVPTVGTMPAWVSAAGYLYAQGSPGKAAAMVVVGMFVGVLDNVVRPWVLRGRQEMHPMISLLAILGGLALLGLPGVFIGPLLAAVAISVLDLWPAVASFCGVPVHDDDLPDIPMIPPTR